MSSPLVTMISVEELMKVEAVIRKCRDTFMEYVEIHKDKLDAFLSLKDELVMSQHQIELIKEKIKRNQDMVDLCNGILKEK